MNKKLKNNLRSAFDAPLPTGKDAFLKRLRYPKINYRTFLFSQLRYIRKQVWLGCVLIAIACWAVAFLLPASADWFTETEKIWGVSSFLPFLALLTTVELYRSPFFGMSELEACCRFSLPQIVMARIMILGSCNFTLLVLLFLSVGHASPYGLLQITAYLLVPYLITCGSCLLVQGRLRGREGIYICAAVASFVSMGNVICGATVRLLYSDTYWNCWLLLLVAGGVFLGIQLRNLLKQTEDRIWNLSLTE